MEDQSPLDPKPFWKSRTFWVMVLVIIAGILQLISDTIVINEPLTGWLTVLIGALGIILRAISGEPIKW